MDSEVTPEEMKKLTQKGWGLADNAREYFTLWDLRSAPFFHQRAIRIWQVAKQYMGEPGKVRPGGKTAILSGPGAQHGVGRMIEQIMDGNVHWQYKAFVEEKKALEWLGLG